jgi:hypothetical protein
MWFDCRYNVCSDLVLHGEHVICLPVVFLRPDVLTSLGVDQLPGDSNGWLVTTTTLAPRSTTPDCFFGQTIFGAPSSERIPRCDSCDSCDKGVCAPARPCADAQAGRPARRSPSRRRSWSAAC